MNLFTDAHMNDMPEVPAISVDEARMRRSLDLAWKALGYTEPNPMVGAVVIDDDGDEAGAGYHRRCGADHAEIIALDEAGERARGATLYVTLEPCSHHGRTPPCVDAIIAAGIRRVVVPTLDPDVLVYGQGVERLRSAGIRVDVGTLAAEAVARNLSYYRNRLGLGPTVTLKIAATMDGKIASSPGHRDRITGPAAQQFVHRMRAASDCVVVGTDTVIVDRPRLDCRFLSDAPAAGKAPVPVVLDTNLRAPRDNHWADENREYIVFCGRDVDETKAAGLSAVGVTLERCDYGPGGVAIGAVVEALSRLGFERIMVEGGAGVFTSFLDSNQWHALYLFQSQAMFGENGVPMYRGEGSPARGALVEQSRVGDDTLHLYINPSALNGVLERVRETRGS